MDIVTRQDAAPTVERGVDSPLGEVHIGVSHPEFWIIQARRSPSLARILVACACGPRQSAAAPASMLSSWCRRFLSAPPWHAVHASLCERLATAAEDADGITVANLACAIAERSGWATTEAAYWTALLEPVAALDPVGEATDAPEQRCVRLARLLLTSRLGDRFRTTDADFADDLRYWQQRWPQLDWKSLEAEATFLAGQPSGIWRPDWDRLVQSASVNAERLKGRLFRLLFEISSAGDAESLLQLAAEFLELLTSESVALWISPPESDSGIGLFFPDRAETPAAGGDSALVPDRLTLWTEPVPAADFLQRLPATLRSSAPLAEGESKSEIGRLYLAFDPAPRLSEWTVRLAAAVGAWSERRALRDRQRRQSAEADDWAKRTRLRLRSAIKEFSAGAAHEINNPLGAIQGHAQRLLSDERDPNRRAELTTIVRQVTRIHEMIRDLHLVGRGGLHSDPTSSISSVAAVVQSAVRRLGAPVPGVELRIAPIPENLSVCGDDRDLGRALEEILRNALAAASPTGRAELKFRIDGSGWRRFSVTDSGPGFRPAELLHAFDPFYSGRTAGRRLGMGLTVAQSIVEAAGGRIVLQSSIPTCVEILLPPCLS